ncbi:MAG: 50S ribosomal protein L28 [bacterium TMED198]|nr:MAG: 50S ribosomal protein L28 [bacterium TMED198]
MSKVCQITGKRPLVANNVSKSNRKTKRRQLPNLQSKRLFVPELGRTIKLKIATKAIKGIDKHGLIPYLKKEGLTLSDLGY